MNAPPVKGRPVSQEELDELNELRALFKPEASTRALDAFSTWLFATVAIVGTLGTALGVTGVNELSGEGRELYVWAVVALGASLALATISRIPQLARFNPHSALSMRKQMNRILVIRASALALAGVAFAAALVLAALAPLESSKSAEKPPLSMTYTLSKTGQLVAHFAVSSAEPLTPLFSELRTQAPIPQSSAPRARTMTNADGDATVSLKLQKATSYRRVVLVGRWTDESGSEKASRLVIWTKKKAKGKP